MSMYSKLAIAIDPYDWPEIEPYVIEANRVAGVNCDEDREVHSDDCTYRILYWDYVCAYSEAFIALKREVEKHRHAIIDIREDGLIERSVRTDDGRGCDEEFEEILNWRTDICVWGEDVGKLAVKSRCERPWEPPGGTLSK